MHVKVQWPRQTPGEEASKEMMPDDVCLDKGMIFTDKPLELGQAPGGVGQTWCRNTPWGCLVHLFGLRRPQLVDRNEMHRNMKCRKQPSQGFWNTTFYCRLLVGVVLMPVASSCEQYRCDCDVKWVPGIPFAYEFWFPQNMLVSQKPCGAQKIPFAATPFGQPGNHQFHRGTRSRCPSQFTAWWAAWPSGASSPGFGNVAPNPMWGPQKIAKWVYNSNHYGSWCL